MNKRILLADDSLTIQKVVELTFMDESFEVEAVGSGDEAISSLEREAPSILIADVHMPGPSGYEVCRRAKELDPEMPVLLLIGTFEALDEEELVACGADGNLKKPFDSQELLQRVKEMVAGRASATPSAREEPAVEGFETTFHEVEESEVMAPPEPTGYETTAFSLDPQPGDEPEFVPTAGFDIGRDNDDEEALGAERDEAPALPAPDPEPMDELLGALDEVEARVGASGATWAAEDAAVDAVLEGEPAPEPEPKAPPAAPAEPVPPSVAAGSALSEADVDRVARRVVEILGEETVREVAWEVIPDMAEIVIKDRIRELEAEAE